MKKVLKVIALIILMITFYCVYEIYASENILKVSQYNSESTKIKEPVKVIILGDLHNHEFGEKLITKVMEQHPDLILMAGDMIDHDKKDEFQITKLIKDMKEIAPVYYALGNHEKDILKEHPDYIEKIASAGAVYLDCAYEDIQIKNNEIRIGGLYEYPFGLIDNFAESAHEDIRSFMEEYTDTEAYKIFIAHRPDSFVFGDTAKVYDIDLVVSGHMHGGQVILPFLGGLYGGDLGWFPEYYHGMYVKDNIHLLITSGLGTSHKKLPRFNNRPEIMVLNLSPEN